MSPSYLLLGELRETGGMLSGGGSAEFLAGNASRWADQRARKLDDLTAAVRCLLDSGRPKCS